MQIFGQVLFEIQNFMLTEFQIFGYTLNYWEIAMFTGAADIIAWIIARVLNDD